jgi:hypothetical protein
MKTASAQRPERQASNRHHSFATRLMAKTQRLACKFAYRRQYNSRSRCAQCFWKNCVVGVRKFKKSSPETMRFVLGTYWRSIVVAHQTAETKWWMVSDTGVLHREFIAISQTRYEPRVAAAERAFSHAAGAVPSHRSTVPVSRLPNAEELTDGKMPRSAMQMANVTIRRRWMAPSPRCKVLASRALADQRHSGHTRHTEAGVIILQYQVRLQE